MRPNLLIAVVGPLAILAASAIVTLANWERIPERFPVHFGLNGQPDRWSTRGPGVFLPLAIGAAVILLTQVIAFVKRKQQPAVPMAAVTGSSYFVALLLGYLTMRPVWFGAGPATDMPWTFAAIFAGVIALAAIGIRDARQIAETPSDGWKWGVIYYNPADPSLMVAKRYGMGWTFNFANRWSWIVMAALLMLPFSLLLIR